LGHYLKLRGIDPTNLMDGLNDYLADVDQLIREEYNHYEDPFGYLAAKQYEQGTEKFRDILAVEIDE
jgi:hypothetical protein